MFSIMRGIFLLQHTAIIAIDIVKRDFDGLPTFFVNSETKSPSSTLTEQVPRESFSTVCLDFRIILPRLMKVSCVPFHQLWPNSNTQHKFLVFFSLKIAKKSLWILNTISLVYYLVVVSWNVDIVHGWVGYFSKLLIYGQHAAVVVGNYTSLL